MSAAPTDEEIAQMIQDLAHQREVGKSFCPSEVARGLSTDWRPLMPRVRAVAAELDGVVATQKGQVVDPRNAKGPIRLGLGQKR